MRDASSSEGCKHRASQFVNTICNQYGRMLLSLDDKLAVKYFDVIIPMTFPPSLNNRSRRLWGWPPQP